MTEAFLAVASEQLARASQVPAHQVSLALDRQALPVALLVPARLVPDQVSLARTPTATVLVMLPVKQVRIVNLNNQ